MKICKYLDGNQIGMAMLYTPCASVCCDRGIPLMDIDDFSSMDVNKYIALRNDFIEGINNGTRHECEGCVSLVEKNRNEVDTNKFSCINLATFTTCNLRCKYCYYKEQQLGAKLEENKKYIMPVLLKLHNTGRLKDNICLGIAGGEPTLFEDIPEALAFLEKNYKNPRFNLQSNSTLTTRVRNIAKAIQSANMPWKHLYTSVDAGTKETYKKIRGRDLFYEMTNNLIFYAKNGVFTDMGIKYMLLNNPEKDIYNLSMEDIFGFCNLLKSIVKFNPNKTIVYIDRDMNDPQKLMSTEMLKAGGIISYAARKLGIDCIYSTGNFICEQDRCYINNFADNYEIMEKTPEEEYLLQLFLNNCNEEISKKTGNNISLLQKLFSVTNTPDRKHKVWCVLGVKMKFKKRAQRRASVERE